MEGTFQEAATRGTLKHCFNDTRGLANSPVLILEKQIANHSGRSVQLEATLGYSAVQGPEASKPPHSHILHQTEGDPCVLVSSKTMCRGIYSLLSASMRFCLEAENIRLQRWCVQIWDTGNLLERRPVVHVIIAQVASNAQGYLIIYRVNNDRTAD
jgi:hypothetical protein